MDQVDVTWPVDQVASPCKLPGDMYDDGCYCNHRKSTIDPEIVIAHLLSSRQCRDSNRFTSQAPVVRIKLYVDKSCDSGCK